MGGVRIAVATVAKLVFIAEYNNYTSAINHEKSY